MMYEDIGRVALEAIDKIKAANESDNNNLLPVSNIPFNLYNLLLIYIFKRLPL